SKAPTVPRPSSPSILIPSAPGCANSVSIGEATGLRAALDPDRSERSAGNARDPRRSSDRNIRATRKTISFGEIELDAHLVVACRSPDPISLFQLEPAVIPDRPHVRQGCLRRNEDHLAGTQGFAISEENLPLHRIVWPGSEAALPATRDRHTDRGDKAQTGSPHHRIRFPCFHELKLYAHSWIPYVALV